MSAHSAVKYRREIDGLRAVAVVPVILFHAGLDAFGGGYVGVDVFFVISGFLITTILLKEKAAGTFTFAGFYERRARRILPVLFFIMAVCCVPAYLWLVPVELTAFAQSVASVTLFGSNIYFWMHSGYFDTAAELTPLLHTWSLSVEEQFYLLFPPFLMLTWRLSRRSVALLLALSAAVSLGLAHYGATHFRSATFFLLPTRAWELAIGSLIAFHSVYRAPTALARVAQEGLAAGGLLLIGYAVFAFDEAVPFPSLYALIPTVGTGLIILFASADTTTGKLLGSRVLVGIGLVSYSAYLWHQPLFAFARHLGTEDPRSMLGLSTAVVPLSFLSWKFVETPCRDRTRFSRRRVFAFSAGVSIAFCALGFWGDAAAGFPARAMFPRTTTYRFDNRALQEESWGWLESASGDEHYRVEGSQADHKLWFEESNKTKLLVVGNSHSKDLFNALHESRSVQEHFALARFGAQIGCLEQPEAHFFDSPNYRAADVVMLSSRYLNLSCGSTRQARRVEDFADLVALRRVLSRIARDGKTTVVISNVMEFRQYGVLTLADQLVRTAYAPEAQVPIDPALAKRINEAHYADYRQGDYYDPHRDIHAINRALRAIAQAEDALYLDRNQYLCDDQAAQCFAVSSDLHKCIYDYGHNTLEGAALYGRRIDAIDWLAPLIAARTPEPKHE